MPKPGWYLTNDVYFMSGDRSELTPLGDRVVGNVDADALINIAQVTWVADATVLGGRVALSGVLPYGNVDVSASGAVVAPGGITFEREIEDSVTGIGDLALGGSLGWKKRTGDRFRAWSGYASVFAPTGDYELGRTAKMSKNRWALDVGGAYTMANFKGGRELSTVLGFTFSEPNRDTDHESVTDMHLKFAGKQHLPSHWSLGVVGYWYEQIMGDDNNPEILSDFKGRAIALGPEVSYQFTKNPQRPVTIDLRWYHEFGVKNRLEGDSVFLTVSLPLAITTKPQPAQKQTAGCYIFEPGGSIHEFNTPATNTEDTDTFMVVFGANVNFLKDGTYINLMDAGMIKAWADQGIKDQGLTNMNYISARVPTYTR